MRWRVALAGWLLALLLLVLLTPWDAARSGFAPKGVERIVLFALEEGGEATFRVSQADSGLRVLTYLDTDAPSELDEATTWLYGFELELVGQTRTQFREHWTRSRLTLLDDGSPATVPPAAGRVITDSRIVDLDRAEHWDEGGELIIRPRGLRPGERMLVRVFRVDHQGELGLSGSMSRSARERVARLYPLPWPVLEPSEWNWHAALKRETLPASRLVGETVAVLRHEVPSLAPTSQEWGYRLEPGDATAVNVHGPSVLTVWTAKEAAPEASLPSTLPIELVDASWDGPVDGGEITPHRVFVPDGALWSLRWHLPWSAQPLWISYELDPVQGKSWGEPPGAGGGQPQEPERRRITVYRAGVQGDPIDVPVIAARRWGVLRVEARPLADDVWKLHPPRPSQPPVTLYWQALDADGEVLDEGQYETTFDHAPFERYVEEKEEREPISEKDVRYLHHRREAVTLRFEASAPVDLRFLVPLEVQPERAPEYGLPEDFIARYAPWELAPYVTVAPSNHDDLVLEERLQRFDATVRIERRDDDEGLDRLHTQVVYPWNAEESFPAFMTLKRRARWQDWYRTRVSGPTDLIVEDEGLLLEYRVDEADIGSPVGLTCDGFERDTQELLASTGSLWWALPEGETSCELDAPDGLWLARAEGSGLRWGRRSLFRADQHDLRLNMPVTEGANVLFVRAYTRSGNAPTLTVLVDGGDPDRSTAPSERYTPVEREFTPQETRISAQLVNGGALVGWQAMRVVLGDDISPGTHDIRVHAEGVGGEAVWVRMDGTWSQAREAGVRHWTEETR
jgi:hypothetical protein